MYYNQRSCRQEVQTSVRVCTNNKAPRHSTAKSIRTPLEKPAAKKLATLGDALSIQPVRTRNEFDGIVVQSSNIKIPPRRVKKCPMTTSRPPNSPVSEPVANEIINTAQQVLQSARKYNDESTNKLETVLTAYKNGPQSKLTNNKSRGTDFECIFQNNSNNNSNGYYLESEIREAVEKVDLYESGKNVSQNQGKKVISNPTYSNPYDSNFMTTFLRNHPEHKVDGERKKTGPVIKKQSVVEKDNKIPVQKKDISLPKKTERFGDCAELSSRFEYNLNSSDSRASLDGKLSMDNWHRLTSKSANSSKVQSHKAPANKHRSKLSPRQIDKTLSEATQRITEMKAKYGAPTLKSVKSVQNIDEGDRYASILAMRSTAKAPLIKAASHSNMRTGRSVASVQSVAPSSVTEDFSDEDLDRQDDFKNEDDNVIAILRRLQISRKKQEVMNNRHNKFFSSESESETETCASENVNNIEPETQGTQTQENQPTKFRKTYLDATKSHYLLKDMSIKNKEPIGNIDSLLDASPRKNQTLLNQLKLKYPKFFLTKESENIKGSYKIEQRLKEIENLSQTTPRLVNSNNTFNYQETPTRYNAGVGMSEVDYTEPQHEVHKYQYPSQLYSYKY